MPAAHARVRLGRLRGKSKSGTEPDLAAVCSNDPNAKLEDKQIVAIFEEFDTSGDGFIDLGELEAALSRAGKRVSREEVSISLDHLCAHMTTNTCAVLVLHTLPGTANLGSSGREQGWADLSR